MKKNLFFFIASLLVLNAAYSQMLSYTDPAAAYSRILIEKSGEGSYQKIGNFKVIGTAYLFGEKLNGNAYTSTAKAEGIPISYNTYIQQLDVYQNGAEVPLRMVFAEIDSFKLLASGKTEFKEDLLFLNSKIVDSSSSKPVFLQVVHTGNRFSLYKAYKSTMGYVSTNYIQSELRQFDLGYEYYYYDNQKPGLKKLKLTKNNIINTFKPVADVSAFFLGDAFDTRPEHVLTQVFTAIN